MGATTAGVGRAPAAKMAATPTRVSFQTEPGRYRHWRLAIDGPVATLAMDVAEDGGLGRGQSRPFFPN